MADRIEYTDERPLDVDEDGDVESVGALLAALLRAVEPAVAHLGEFGITMGAHRDGALSLGFGPNMRVDWAAVHASQISQSAVDGDNGIPTTAHRVSDGQAPAPCAEAGAPTRPVEVTIIGTNTVLREAIADALSVLGTGECSVQQCPGCAYEQLEAVRILREALDA